MLFECYCMAVEHSETNLRIGFAIFAEETEDCGEKQTGVTPGWPGTKYLERGTVLH